MFCFFVIRSSGSTWLHCCLANVLSTTLSTATSSCGRWSTCWWNTWPRWEIFIVLIFKSSMCTNNGLKLRLAMKENSKSITIQFDNHCLIGIVHRSRQNWKHFFFKKKGNSSRKHFKPEFFFWYNDFDIK